MLRRFVSTCLFAGCLVSLPAAGAQEIIHALTGTVASINGASKTISVLQDNGTRRDFDLLSNPKTRIAFDKRIEADSTAAASFDKQGAYAIVFFYYGQGDARTVVALKSLGKGPFSSVEGTVTNFDSHGHTIAVKDQSGAVQTLKMDAQTVAEGNMGAVPGDKFHADKGDHVRIVSSGGGGEATALFMRDL
ncbi:hypothetical protein [Occallatibacter riparius]|uniref:DUF5666 domain-containing protein n=1 Tax=Occallatibacter riparius TaxID=1002689 RepID=A0A9J7BQE2_9BACT|nr:hypothetical protein [Occallatibacter riparius]UWZ83158.1 hypothetical protein MOP44_21630 [Occallatibacter riparius]